MANTIITKNSATASAVPTSGDLVQGELAVNVTDKRLFTENSGGTVVELGTNPTSLTTGGLTVNLTSGYARIQDLNTAVVSGTNMGGVEWRTGDSSVSGANRITARIRAEGDGTFDAADKAPTKLIFSTHTTSGVDPLDRMNIASNGDISFYEDTGTTAKFFWDASAESLGIGTAAPTNVKLQLNAVSDTVGTGSLGLGGGSSPLFVWRINSTGDKLHLDKTYGGVWDTPITIDRQFAYVGIGTVAPASLLTIGGNVITTAKPTLAITDTVNGASITLRGLSPKISFDITSSGTPTILMDGAGIEFKDGTLDAEGNVDLKIDSSGNVGIGTTSPSTFNTTGGKLVVASGASSVAALFSDSTYYTLGIKHTGVGSEAVGMFGGTSGSSLALMTNNTERLRITSSGNVGIGTTSPNGKLQVTGGTTNASNLATSYSSAAFTLVPKSTSGFSLAFGSGPSDFPYIQMSANGAVASNMLLQPYGGNVGIGTSSPVQKAHLDGGAGDTYLQFSNSTTGSTSSDGSRIGIASADTALRIQNLESAPIRFDIAGSERARIDSSGNLLVGTTSASNLWRGTAPSNGVAISSAEIDVQISTNNNFYVSKASGYTDGTYMSFWVAGAQVGSITTSGSSTSFNTSSDYRLKEDVQSMTGASERVKALKPVNFAWKSDGSRVDGFLAHEAQAVVPEAVYGEKDAVDAEGNPKYQGIDQSKLVPLLTAALQEALTEIESLKARLDAANL